MSRQNFDLSLYLVTDRSIAGHRDLIHQVLEAVQGGCTMVQLREKNLDTKAFVEEAIALKHALKGTGVPLIINDRIDVALAADADGVHIGQSDMPYELARKLIGPDKIIGLSVENLEEITFANSLDVDYIGVSPVFATTTKTDTSLPFGLDGTRKAVALSKHPVVAIGGMNRNTAPSVMEQGVDGIAVVSDIMGSDCPQDVAQELLQKVKKHRLHGTHALWEITEEVRGRIWKHPFLHQMADGTLPMEQFLDYLQQDRLYLQAYYPRMQEVAALLTDESEKQLFVTFAEMSQQEEDRLHQLLLGKHQLSAAALPHTLSYIAHERACTQSGHVAVALSGLLPCMWIYCEVGEYLQTIATVEDGHPYMEWIKCYADPEMATGARQVCQILDRLMETISIRELAEVRYAYSQSAEEEYHFWNQIIQAK